MADNAEERFMKRMMWKVLLVATLAAGVLLAQDDKPTAPTAESEYFRLNFVVKEIENGKVVNSRNYSTLMPAGGKDRASIRATSKATMPSGSSFQFVDVGANIDCSSMRRLQNRLAMNVEVGLSTAVPSQDKGTPTVPQIRSNRWNVPVVVTIGKPTVLFSSDDLASTRTLQLELTATPVK
jgi:hypothetical protein